MKKYLSLFVVLVIAGAGMLATQGLSAQKRVVKVQGHPHEYLTQKHGGKEDATIRTLRSTGNVYNIDLASIECWTGNPNLSLPIDSAVLVIKWTDGKLADLLDGDSILAWGYRWNSIDQFGSAVHKYTIDMIRAVANADCRFSVLLQNSSGINFVVGGFGINAGDYTRVPVQFDAQGAERNDSIRFGYTSPNCSMGQGAVPYSVTDQATDAIRRSSSGFQVNSGTGIIRHPFDADYGYPAYDFDYWTMVNPDAAYQVWQSGWLRGYWTFSHKEQLRGNFTADTLSISTRELHNHYVDGFVYNNQPDIWPPVVDMSGDYLAIPGCACICIPPSGKKENITGKRK